jgi:hypothetical protein
MSTNALMSSSASDGNSPLPQTEFEIRFSTRVFPLGARTANDFRKQDLFLDPMRDTAGSIKDRLGIHGIVIHNAAIVGDSALLKNWYQESSKCPIVVVETPSLFEESQEWERNGNLMARLLNAGSTIECALVALGRCYWQEGFGQFSLAATSLRTLVDHSGTFDYQRRLEVMCLSHPQKLPMPVAVYNEFSAKLMLPPVLKGDLSGGPLLDHWVDKPNKTVSMEEKAQISARARRVETLIPHLETAGEAVVRGFGYHEDKSGRTRVVPFTAFFVSPKHLLTCRTSKFSAQYDSYATRFTISRRIRAVHGMLSSPEDLIEAKEVTEANQFLVDSIRRLGINLEDSKVPPSFQATAWSDLLLLEVTDPRYYTSSYLLPELDPQLRRDDEVFAIQYTERPTAAWLQTVFGEVGHVGKGQEYTEDLLRIMCWSYDTKLCSLGYLTETPTEVEGNTLKHSCTMMPGSRGAPLLKTVRVDVEGKHGTYDNYGQKMLPISTYIGISTGRAMCHFLKETENIIQMSTGELARVDSLASNMFNEAASCSQISLVLLYQKFISPAIADTNHKLYLHKYLHPWSILTDSVLLSKCHKSMLLDADDDNEYGMDFYDHHDLNSAQACFREGARMFSTASIPNLSQHEIELRAALQTNVSAVVVAKLKARE